MEAFAPWLTPALVVALIAWLRSELISRTDKIEKRFESVERRFDAVDKRFDGVIREIAELRERMGGERSRRRLGSKARSRAFSPAAATATRLDVGPRRPAR